MIKVMGISGSLRRHSYNTGLLRAAVELAPAGMDIEIADIAAIPAYDADVQAGGFPPEVLQLAGQLREADGVMIATPEYNYSVPGVLKNAIDWVSRVQDQPFNRKAIAIMGATMGNVGTARAQYHLRQIFVFLNGLVMNRPEVFVGAAHEKYDSRGNLTHGPTREFLADYLANVETWINTVVDLNAASEGMRISRAG